MMAVAVGVVRRVRMGMVRQGESQAMAAVEAVEAVQMPAVSVETVRAYRVLWEAIIVQGLAAVLRAIPTAATARQEAEVEAATIVA